MADNDIKIQEIRYFRRVGPPTLKQFLHRKAMSQAMKDIKGLLGTDIDPETKTRMPVSSITIKQRLKGITAEDVAKLHPNWVEEYKRRYSDGS